MTTFEIEHEWDPSNTNTVVEKVNQAIGIMKSGKGPAGFKPHVIYAVNGKTTARCVWEAPSAKALEGLFAQLGVPTRRKISEISVLYE